MRIVVGTRKNTLTKEMCALTKKRYKNKKMLADVKQILEHLVYYLLIIYVLFILSGLTMFYDCCQTFPTRVLHNIPFMISLHDALIYIIN